MVNKTITLAIVTLFLSFNSAAMAADTALDDMLNQYTSEGAGPFHAEAGKKMWVKTFPAPIDAENPKPRSCQTCHGVDLTQKGEHIRTGKIIEPMALSINPERYTEAKKIKKWFRRNCKWVLGRTCTAQEKGDFLTYLKKL